MKLSDFDYDLPTDRIAQAPAPDRDQSKLLVVDRRTNSFRDMIFSQIAGFFEAGDVLVLNETKVIPARLLGRRSSGAKVEIFLLRRIEQDTWEILARPGKRVRPGDEIHFAIPELKAKILDITEEGGRIAAFSYDGIWEEVLDRAGTMPLPPYIKDYRGDMSRYQTVYAHIPGSVAAPTAGLHFTEELLSALAAKGVNLAKVQLNVGLGTFRPVEVENIEEHKMHKEYYEITEEAAKTINKAKKEGKRIIACGTTSTRVLETVAAESGRVHAASGWTGAYIYPGYRYKAVDGLITNFHLPKSSLLMLVSALAGRDLIFAAYRHAIENGYRFFSFGDAMLIL